MKVTLPTIFVGDNGTYSEKGATMERDMGNQQAIDKRRRLFFDEIRAKYWMKEVSAISGLKTAYSLDKEFGGGQKKWASYARGRVPNVETVAAVMEKFPGTGGLLVSGPADLALWPALDPRTSNELLGIYSRQSKRIDGDIARFRLDASVGKLQVHHSAFVSIEDPKRNPFSSGTTHPLDDFMSIGFDLYIDLYQLEIVTADILELIGIHLFQLIEPFRNLSFHESLRDEWCAVDSSYNAEERENLIEEWIYRMAAVGTVGLKGRR